MSSAKAFVLDVKKSLAKELDCPQLDGESVERCDDLLSRLDEADINLAILSETLIGTVVSKLKSHETLGPKAKSLIKKWKNVAKNGDGKAAATKGSTTSQKVTPSVKSERRESIPSQAAVPNSEWAGLPSHRQTICQKLYEFLLTAKPALIEDGVSLEAIDHLVGPRAAEIESAICRNFPNSKAYSDKARSLAFNLKKNTLLCKDVLLGTIEADDLVKMSSEQLAPEETLKKRAEEARKVIDASRLDWNEANEDKINEMCGIRGDLLKASLFTCGRCKSTKTTSTQKQTRSADEPMTVFVLCLSCGKRWKC
ncbi:hypothetical protein MPSEU_000701700 [Mayamaea pseudoterrestris]|nr:hypothetical protein MPSEU_000701700 [Mayamaea pseudoterrestris]